MGVRKIIYIFVADHHSYIFFSPGNSIWTFFLKNIADHHDGPKVGFLLDFWSSKYDFWIPHPEKHKRGDFGVNCTFTSLEIQIFVWIPVSRFRVITRKIYENFEMPKKYGSHEYQNL